DEGVQVGVLLEVRRLEVVGPEHPQVLLDELRALLLDEDRTGAEVGVVVVGDLGDDALDRLCLDAGLGGVVDTAREVAVGADIGDAEQSGKAHERPFRWAELSATSQPTARHDVAVSPYAVCSGSGAAARGVR